MGPGAGHQTANATPQSPSNPKGRSIGGSSSSSRQRPVSFFFRTGDEMEEDLKTPQQQESMFGVQSLEEVISLADAIQDENHDRPQHPDAADLRNNSLSESHISVESSSQISTTPALAPHNHFPQGNSCTSPIEPLPRQISAATLSLPLTPIFQQSPLSGSVAPSSPTSACSLKSFRLSDDDSIADDTNSLAVLSGGEEEAETTQPEQSQHFPQLVMPSISMPSRRAFTDKGRNIGKLKIVLAGVHGVGKSSLIKSIVQSCEHIVHVDPIPLSSPIIQPGRPIASRRASEAIKSQQNQSITEISASTRAYPSWWSEMDESRVLRRRKSFGEVVLERNISFVDIPGFASDHGNQQGHLTIQYVDGLLQRNASLASMSDGEVLSILSGSGGAQVDLVLYLFTEEPKPEEYELLRHLCQLTNVIPAISKADLLSKDELATLQARTAEFFDSANIRPFSFNEPLPDLRRTHQTALYTVSSALSSDIDNMDASVLMSPDYIQPVVESDLGYLINKIFDPEGAAWLRHSAARKFLHWRRITSASQTIHSSSTAPSSLPATTSALSALKPPSAASRLYAPSPTQVLVNLPSVTSDTGSPYTLARLNDHTQREERLAQVRLARWAADLQRSLANERERYTTLHASERAGWLHERLDECESSSSAGQLIRRDDGSGGRRGKRASMAAWPKVLDRRDPLGLLEWDDRLRQRAVVLAKVLGGAGIVGAVAVWVLRTWSAGFGGGAGGLGGWGLWSGVNE